MIEVKLSVEEYNRLFMLYLDRDFDYIFCRVQNDSIIFTDDYESDYVIAKVKLNTPEEVDGNTFSCSGKGNNAA